MATEQECGAVIFDRDPSDPEASPVCVIVWLSRATVDSATVQKWLALARRRALPCRVAIEEPLDLPDDLFAGIQDCVVEPTFTQAEKTTFVWRVRMELFPQGM